MPAEKNAAKNIDEMQQKIVEDEMFRSLSSLDIDRFDLCLQKGANLNGRDALGDTPLMILVGRHPWKTSFIKHILKKKPDLFATNKAGKTVFDIAHAINNDNDRNEMKDILLKELPDKTYVPGKGIVSEEDAKADATPAAVEKDIQTVPPVTFKKKPASKPGFNL